MGSWLEAYASLSPLCHYGPLRLYCLFFATLRTTPRAFSLKYLTLRMFFLVAAMFANCASAKSAQRAPEIHALWSDTLQFSSMSVTVHADPDSLPEEASSWQSFELHRVYQMLVRPLTSSFSAMAAQKLVHLSQKNVAFLLGSKPRCLMHSNVGIFQLLRESRVIRLGVKQLFGRKQLTLTLRRFATLPCGLYLCLALWS